MNELQVRKTIISNSTLRAIYWVMVLMFCVLLYIAWTVYQIECGNQPRQSGPAVMDSYPG